MGEKRIVLKGQAVEDVTGVMRMGVGPNPNDPLADPVAPPAILVRTEPEGGLVTTEFYLTLLGMAGCIAAGIILICKGKIDEGKDLIMVAAGAGGVYTAARSYAKK